MRKISIVLVLLALAATHSHAVTLKGGIPQKVNESAAVLKKVALPRASLPIQDRLNRILRSTGLVDAKIVGGVAAGPKEFPWQVALVLNGYEPRDGQFCGGSVIAPQWVVTAAHCVDNGTTPEMLYVFYGSNNLATPGRKV